MQLKYINYNLTFIIIFYYINQATTSHQCGCSSSESTTEVFFSDDDSAVAMDPISDDNGCVFSADLPGGERCESHSRETSYPCPALTMRDGELEGSCAVCKIEESYPKI